MVDDHLPFPSTMKKRQLCCKLYVATRNTALFLSNVDSQSFLGQSGGQAIADVLFGTFNPGGRIAISIPSNIGQLPVYYKYVSYNEECTKPH